jgi:hypothetical protein
MRIDGVTYGHDVIIDRGRICKRKKAPSKKFRDVYGHTPLSVAEEIPWRCRRLVIGAGAGGALPVMKEVEEGTPTERQPSDRAHGGGDRTPE